MLGYVSEREFKLQFEDSFKQFFKPLCFHAMSFVKDADIAKDIVHDVFLTTWTQREKIDFTQPMLPYYLSLTRNRSLNYLDHLKVRARPRWPRSWALTPASARAPTPGTSSPSL